MTAKKAWRIALPILIGATTLFIWSQSLLPAEQSQEQSGFVRNLLDALLGDGPIAVFLLANIRKVAHFAEFFLLGAEWSGYHRVRRCPVAWLYGLPVAVADELLQFVSPGRAPAVGDVALDMAGYLCGFAVTIGIARLGNRICHHKKKEK